MSRRDSDRARELELEKARIAEEANRRTDEAKARVDAKLANYLDQVDADRRADEDDTAVHRLNELLGRAPSPAPSAEPTIDHPTLPSPAPEPAETPTPTTLRPAEILAEQLRPRTERILVVDDDRHIRRALGELFESEGYSVRYAVDGVDAIRKIFASPPPPDLIVLDLTLPLVSGAGVLALLQREAEHNPLARVPVLVITAGDARRARPGAHRQQVFTKPIEPDSVLAAVRQLVAEWRASGAGRL